GRDLLTGVGLAIGTPAYMSPEQVLGENVGPPSDVYSLAVTFYEMVAGQPPFVSKSSPVAVAMQHVTTPVPPLATRGVMLPTNVPATLERALAKDPTARFPTAAEFGAALESTDGSTTTAPIEQIPTPLASVVVLPLANVSGDRESEYLSDGITEE